MGLLGSGCRASQENSMMMERGVMMEDGAKDNRERDSIKEETESSMNLIPLRTPTPKNQFFGGPVLPPKFFIKKGKK